MTEPGWLSDANALPEKLETTRAEMEGYHSLTKDFTIE
jgi:hypothetical protein